MTGAPAAGYQAEPGVPASAVPAALREIGFDQNLDQQLPLDVDVPRRAGRAVQLGDYFGSEAGRARLRLLRLPDALHAGAERRCRARSSVLSLDAGKDFEIVTVSFDPRETPAQRRGEEGGVPASATSGRARPTAGTS